MTPTVRSLVEDVAAGRKTAEEVAPEVGKLVSRWVYLRQTWAETNQAMLDSTSRADDPPMPDNVREFVYRALESGRITKKQHDVLRHSWDESIQFRQRMRRQQIFRYLPAATMAEDGTLDNEDLLSALASYFDLDEEREDFDVTFGTDWYTVAADWPPPPSIEPRLVNGMQQWIHNEDMPTRWVFAGSPKVLVMGIDPNSVLIGFPVITAPGDMTVEDAINIDMDSFEAMEQVAVEVIGLRDDWAEAKQEQAAHAVPSREEAIVSPATSDGTDCQS